METFFDYLTQTKAMGYIIAAVLLVGFVPFWQFLTEREKNDDGGPLKPR
jgi:hypothetical protein